MNEPIPQAREEPFDVVLARYLQEVDEGRNPARSRYLAEHPHLDRELRAFFAGLDRMQSVANKAPAQSAPAAPTSEEESVPPGTMLGQYVIEFELGRGGMGTVYKGSHTHLQRAVAIKVLPRRLARDAQFVSRFKREARALAQLQHENIVAIHDMGVQDDLYYFVMEYVDGVTLRALIDQHKLAPSEALSLVPKICSALEYAHSRDVVHRDVKPENILIDRHGEPKIADFGLARLVQNPEDTRITRTDVLLGTLNYMAPEQRMSSAVDHRADIYALGVVLYEMLTGQLPTQPLTRPSDRSPVDARIDDVVERALEQDPERRYQRADHMGQDVTKVISSPGLEHAGERGVADRSIVPIFDRQSGDKLGTCRGVLRLEVVRGSVEVRAWARPEVVVASSKRYARAEQRGEGDQAVLVLPKGSHSVHVPERMQVTVRAPKADVSVIGLKSALAIEPGTGEVTVNGHAGPLSVTRLEEGEIEVDGLLTSDFSLSSEQGDITLAGLSLKSGRGNILTQEGSVSMGVTTGESAFTYEARTVSGSVKATLCTVECGEHFARGKVGDRGGAISVSSGTGDVDIRSHESMLQHHAWAENWWWVAALVFGSYWWIAKGEVEWWVVMVLVFGASSSLWHLVRWRRRRD